MTLQLELSPQQESWLKQKAQESGLDEGSVALAALDQLRVVENPCTDLSDEEDRLCAELEQELPAEIDARRIELESLRVQRELTQNEQRELSELISLVETTHAARLARAAKLADLRDVEFDQVAREYGLVNELA